MATKITIRRTATRKDGNSKGMVKTTTKTTVTPSTITTTKSRALKAFLIPKDVDNLKGS